VRCAGFLLGDRKKQKLEHCPKGEIVMPRGDRTGPMGMGPMTGRRMGVCTGAVAQANYAGGYGVGCGRGPGFGRGFRRMAWGAGVPGWGGAAPFVAAAAPVDTKAVLAERAAFLQSELEIIKKQLETLSEE
jgi:hypothetical protein